MNARFGLIGCGLIGQKRGKHLEKFGDMVFVCDKSDASMSSFEKSAKEDSWEIALGRYDVDALFVATYHNQLTQIAKQALQKGLHVFIEKPGGTNANDLKQLDICSENQILRIGYNHRFHPAIQKLKQIYECRQFGELMFLRACYGHGGRKNYQSEWRFKKSLSGGGELLDQGAHVIDILNWILGPNLDVEYASLEKAFWQGAVEDTAFVCLRHSLSGAPIQLSVSWCEWRNIFRLELMFEKAKVQIDGLGGSYGTEQLKIFAMTPEMGPPKSTLEEFLLPDLSFQAEINEFLQLTGLSKNLQLQRKQADLGQSGATLDEAINNLEIIDEIYRSCK